MSQEDYDQGYEDGRASREEEIVGIKLQLQWARADLERERKEVTRYRDIVHRPNTRMRQ